MDADTSYWVVTLIGDVNGTMYVYGDPTTSSSIRARPSTSSRRGRCIRTRATALQRDRLRRLELRDLQVPRNGWVTDAASDWEYLVGHKSHEIGTTTDPFTGNPSSIIGDSEMFFAGP
jgi:hypothetical protein